MQDNLLQGIIGAIGGLVGGFLAAGINLLIERRKYKLELVKLMSTAEVEKARVQAYTELWKCLEGISTWHSGAEIVKNLPQVQSKLQEWYYTKGGGLLIEGSAENKASTKAAFFAARHVKSHNPADVWDKFHHLRHCLRRDLKIFETDEDEEKERERVMKALNK